MGTITNDNEFIVLDLNSDYDNFKCLASVSSALSAARSDVEMLDETINSIKALKPDCDKIDYALAASSGALCGIIDIFLVGKPGETFLGNITDDWFERRTCDFAKICGWQGNDQNPVSSAISYLERHFKVPYDQRGCGDAGQFIFDLNPTNHHFKSLAHNPTLLGLFFSILDQFTNSSRFITNGELIELADADGKFQLRGNTFMGKLWCGIVNWFGHLMSDVCGASGTSGRGMGIPSPLWAWMNSVIAIKSKLGIPVGEFDKNFNELALTLYKEGYDFRFQTTQLIPVLINELIVRLCYSIRRAIGYYRETPIEQRSFKAMWNRCAPFKNPTVKRMLTVAHGTFCLVDIGDATIRGFVTGAGSFNPVEFFLRLNIVGLGRFTISLYGETKREINYHRAKNKAIFAERQKAVLEFYISGLQQLEILYDDKEYLTLVDDIRNNDYLTAFAKSSSLAELRGVPDGKILRTKKDIDNYFNNK